MKACTVLALMGADAATLGQQVAQRLHIPFTDVDRLLTETHGAEVSALRERLGEDGFRAEECRTIAEFLSKNNNKFAVLAVGAGATNYMPSALLLAARTTLCCVGDGDAFADFFAMQDSTTDEVIGRWLSPEILSSFSSDP